jgi:hypothetical protein
MCEKKNLLLGVWVSSEGIFFFPPYYYLIFNYVHILDVIYFIIILFFACNFNTIYSFKFISYNNLKIRKEIHVFLSKNGSLAQ